MNTSNGAGVGVLPFHKSRLRLMGEPLVFPATLCVDEDDYKVGVGGVSRPAHI